MRRLLVLALIASALPLAPRNADAAANGKIAFESKRDGNSEIYSMNADGTSPSNLSRSGSIENSASWAPDGNRVAFSSDRDSPGSPNASIYVMNADGGGVARVTQPPQGVDSQPSWAPSGSRLVFANVQINGFNVNGQIFVTNADGSGRTNISNNSGVEYDPAWSPDGNTIAFSDHGAGTGRLMLMSPDGSNRRALTDGETPSWAPDGRRLAFSNGGRIRVANLDNGSVSDLAAGFRPAWSPDGTKIAYDTGGGGADVFVMNADGTNQTNISRSSGVDQGASWQPSQGSGAKCPGHESDPRAQVAGTSGDDVLVGSANVILCGLAGNDILKVTGGSGLLEGGDGLDVLCAKQSQGNDVVDGGPGVDRARYEDGDNARDIERWAPLAFCA
jgi:Tol biopolymer transport system component